MSATILNVSKLVSKLSVSLFTGAAVYCSFVEHRARLSIKTSSAIDQFRPSYKRAAVFQSFLASCGFLGTMTSYYLDKDTKWLIAGVLIVSVIPYTLICMIPTNLKLLDSKLDKDSTEAKSLLQRWEKLHFLRSVVSLASLILLNV